MLPGIDVQSALLASPILVVDDDAMSRLFVEKTLKKKGFTHISSVDSGMKAMEQMEISPPELVILDIYMAGINGLDCCEWIRNQPKLKDLPVLMLTSLTDEKLRFQSFAAGATDFVSKPLHPEELYARVKVHLQNRLNLKSLQIYKNRLDSELQTARELQSAILPSMEEMEYVYKHCKLDIVSYLNTSSEIGGEFWGMKSLFPHQTAIWMADFSGHGVAAALNAYRLQAYLKEYSASAARPGEYLSLLNEKLLQFLLRGHFATMFYGVADARGNRLYYASACTPHPMIVRKDGSVEKIDGSGTPLGICMQFYPTQSVEFMPGDTLVLYSDALTETRDEKGDYITETHIMEFLAQHAYLSATALKEQILRYFFRHSNLSLADDLTLCICRRMD